MYAMYHVHILRDINNGVHHGNEDDLKSKMVECNN